MSKHLASATLLLILALAGCAETAGDKTVQQYGWRVELMKSDELCTDFKDAALKGNRPIQKTILDELQRRRDVSRLFDIDSVAAAPAIGVFEAEVACLWKTPDEKIKRVADNGATEHVYVLKGVERKDATSFALYDETLIFRAGRLISVERSRL